jgi:hypothetical protein
MGRKKTVSTFSEDSQPIKIDAGTWPLEERIMALEASIDRLTTIMESLDHTMINLSDRLAIAIREAIDKHN